MKLILPRSHLRRPYRALASLHRYTEALADGHKIIEIKHDWSKGYSRLGATHLGLGNHEEAIAAYQKGLNLDPNNEAIKSGLADARAGTNQSRKPSVASPFASRFQGPEVWAKLTDDPSTRAYHQQRLKIPSNTQYRALIAEIASRG